MRRVTILLVFVALVAAVACARRVPPPSTTAAQPAPPPTASVNPPAPPERVEDVVPLEAPVIVADGALTARSLDDLNRDSPFKPIYFPLDSADMDEAGRRVAAANGDIMKRNATWTVTVEGHCDERGTAEYNLALGERRAVSVKAYLVSLGIPAARIRTVSYGKEVPFDSGHNEEAWTRNRRAHLVVASK